MTGVRKWLGAGAAGFLLFVVATAATVALRRPAIRQPIAFNHRKHVQENELACSTCHEFFESQAFSGLPTAELCASCHSEPQGKSAEEARLVRVLKAGAPLDWKPLFVQPPHVYYSHQRHVVAGSIECRVCHGGIGESLAPPSAVRPLEMDDCIDCHRRRGAPTDCTTCHR